MITKNYKALFSFLATLTLGLFVVSCGYQEDSTGYATLDPTSPSISISTEVSSETLVEGDQVYTFTVTMSETQLVDVKVFASQVGGDADSHDYEITSSLVIPAGSLSAVGEIKILADDVIEDTETLTIQVGNNQTANATIGSASMNFTILNYEAGDLDIALEWALSSKATDNGGNEFDATEMADLRLLITTAPNNTDIYDGADGGSFEHYVLSSDAPDGDYYVVADFYAANGDIVRDLNLDLEFNQMGVFNGLAYSYPAALATNNSCGLVYYVMAKITKAGESYTFENVEMSSEFPVVDYTGTDAGYDSQVSTTVDCNGMIITGLNIGWMNDWWSEEIIDSGVIYYTVDGSNNVTIEQQYIYTTLYTGAEQPPYDIVGSGTLDPMTGEITLQYTLIQAGTDIAQYIFDNGWWAAPYFEATVTPVMP